MIKSRRIRWAGYVARTGEAVDENKKNACRILVGKPDAKRPLGRPRHSWEGNIKMIFREIRWDGVDWILLAQDKDHWGAFMTTVKNL
jgi:hypothetical protein